MCQKRIKQFFAFVFGERVSVGQGYSPHVLILNHKRSFKKSGIVIILLSLLSYIVCRLLLTSVSTATLATSTITKGWYGGVITQCKQIGGTLSGAPRHLYTNHMVRKLKFKIVLLESRVLPVWSLSQHVPMMISKAGGSIQGGKTPSKKIPPLGVGI